MTSVGPITTSTNTALPKATGLTQSVFVVGTWDGATLVLQASADGTNWVDIPSASFTANGCLSINLNPEVQMRATTTSAGAGTSLKVQIV